MPTDPNATPTVGSEPGAGKDKDGAGKPPESYLGTYRTREDAEKGLAELQKEKDRLAGEIDHLKHSKGSQDKLTDVLAQLAEAQKPKETPKGPDWGAISEHLKKGFEDGDPSYLLATLQNVISDTAGKEDVAKVEQTVAQKLAQLEEAIQLQSPDYLAHKETVAELQKSLPNADRATLLQVAVMIDANKPVAPPADEPPGGSAPSRVSVPPSGQQLEDWQIAAINKALPGGLRDGELEKLKGGK
jgi:hypothetical protein